jgi:hypothetical protein
VVVAVLEGDAVGLHTSTYASWHWTSCHRVLVARTLASATASAGESAMASGCTRMHGLASQRAALLFWQLS